MNRKDGLAWKPGRLHRSRWSRRPRDFHAIVPLKGRSKKSDIHSYIQLLKINRGVMLSATPLTKDLSFALPLNPHNFFIPIPIRHLQNLSLAEGVPFCPSSVFAVSFLRILRRCWEEGVGGGVLLYYGHAAGEPWYHLRLA